MLQILKIFHLKLFRPQFEVKALWFLSNFHFKIVIKWKSFLKILCTFHSTKDSKKCSAQWRKRKEKLVFATSVRKDSGADICWQKAQSKAGTIWWNTWSVSCQHSLVLWRTCFLRLDFDIHCIYDREEFLSNLVDKTMFIESFSEFFWNWNLSDFP